MREAPAVTCRRCERAWHSDTMLEGLALIGHCPRCGGELTFHRTPRPEPRPDRPARRFDRRPPHLVLGIPRRDRPAGGSAV